MRTRIPLGAGSLLLALGLTACAGSPDVDAPTTPPSVVETDPAEPAPVATTDPLPDASAEPSAPLTCETMLTPDMVEALTEQGWTAERVPFTIGEQELEDGLMCMWADYSTATNHGQMYAFARIDDVTARELGDRLQREGWVRSAEGGSTLYTENPDMAMYVDDDGYGMTYEFGDGWVKFADTRQSLILIGAD